MISGDLIVRCSIRSYNSPYYTVHPRNLLQDIMDITGNTFALVRRNAAYIGTDARIVHDGSSLDSKVSTVKCATHGTGKCVNVVNMRTWWRIPTTKVYATVVRNPVTSHIKCTNCGAMGHLVHHCEEKVGYVRVSFVFSHIDTPRSVNMATPRFLPEAEPSLLLLPLPAVLLSDELVDSFFNFP